MKCAERRWINYGTIQIWFNWRRIALDTCSNVCFHNNLRVGWSETNRKLCYFLCLSINMSSAISRNAKVVDPNLVVILVFTSKCYQFCTNFKIFDPKSSSFASWIWNSLKSGSRDRRHRPRREIASERYRSWVRNNILGWERNSILGWEGNSVLDWEGNSAWEGSRLGGK